MRLVAAALVVLAGVSLLGCRDGDDVPRLSAEDRAFVERVVALQQAADWDGLEALVGFTRQPCTFDPPSLDPPCNEGEKEGQLVDAFLWAGCQGSFRRSVKNGGFIYPGPGYVEEDARFYGVVSRPFGDLPSDYHVIFEWTNRESGYGYWFAVRDKQLVEQRSACGGLDAAFGPDPEFLLEAGDLD